MHFSLVFVFAAPLNIKSHKISYLSAFYCYPYFQQSWSLFVPAPNAQCQLYVRYKTLNGWSDWKDILQEEYLNHRYNRLIGNENTVLLLSNSTHYAINTLPRNQTIYKEMFSKTELKVLKHEINQYLKNNYQLKTQTNYEVLLLKKESKETFSNYFKDLKID